MTTKTKTPAIERFVMGAGELALADKWRAGEAGERLCAEAFYKGVIAAHGVELGWLKPQGAGQRRGNEAQAAFDFVRHVYAVYKVGAACAAKFFDANVKSDAILSPEGGRKAQPKKALRDSVFGSKEWGAFVRRMESIADGGAAKPRGAGERKNDAEFILDRAAAIIARLQRDAEKFDGSIAVTEAPKIAKALRDTLAAFDLKVK